MSDAQQTSQAALMLKDFFPFISTLIGAICGAFGAFCVGWLKECRDERKGQHAALHATQYALFSQWNVLEDMRRRFLEPVRTNPGRFHLQKYYLRSTGELKVPLDDLTFILNSDYPNLLQEIHIAEKRFMASVGLLERLNSKRAAIQEKYPPQNLDMATGKCTLVCPDYEAFALKELTDMLYEETDKALPELRNTNVAVSIFIRTNFKGKRYLKSAPVVAPTEHR